MTMLGHFKVAITVAMIIMMNVRLQGYHYFKVGCSNQNRLSARLSSSDILQRQLERSAWEAGTSFVIGCDEAGRGYFNVISPDFAFAYGIGDSIDRNPM